MARARAAQPRIEMIDFPKEGFSLPAEQLAIRAKCFHPTGEFIEFEIGEVEQSIPDRFEKIVRRFPNRVAVKTRNSTWTYDDLNQAANRMARAVLAVCREENESVAVLLEQGIDAIAALLGTLKAGKIYLSLDPSYPRTKTVGTLEDAQASLIRTNNRNFSLATELAHDNCRLLNIDELNSDIPSRDLHMSLAPDTVACIFYTSGSTGLPKGVVHNHRSLLHMVMGHTNNWHICAEDRRLVPHTRSVASGMPNILSALLNGATLHPFDVKQEGVAALTGCLLTEQITIFQLSATLFRQFVETLKGEEGFLSLRLIKLSSEAVYRRDVNLYKKHFSQNCVFVHGLAATEYGKVREYFIDKKTEIKHDIVPVGYAVEGSEILLLNDAGQEVRHGIIGEIAVKSRYLSPGYWRNPKATQAVFLKDPKGGDERIYLTGDLGRLLPDGCLIHCGRKDFRVKVRGYSVEPAEIARALLNTFALKEAVVVGCESKLGDRRLVAYIVPNHRVFSLSALRRTVAEKLPDYMIPQCSLRWKLPRTPNGKIDRRALPDPGQSRPELDTPYVTAMTPVEEQLATIWAEILSLDQVGIHDNFFDLGGHSLAATQVVSQVIKEFQLELPLQALFHSPTVTEMAAVIMEHQAKKLGEKDLERILAELESMSEEEAQTSMAKEFADRRSTPANRELLRRRG